MCSCVLREFPASLGDVPNMAGDRCAKRSQSFMPARPRAFVMLVTAWYTDVWLMCSVQLCMCVCVCACNHDCTVQSVCDARDSLVHRCVVDV
jgi:hypothetical protein